MDSTSDNTSIILSLQRTFAMFKKLGIKTDELKGLLAQATCHTTPTFDQAAFDQLITTAILSKGDKNPSLTFVGQVIISALQQGNEQAHGSSPFIYHVSDLPELLAPYPKPHSPYNPQPLPLSGKVHQPSNYLVDKLGASCFHCGRAGHWHADCPHTRGVANPNLQPPSPTPFCQMRPPTPDWRSQQGLGTHNQRERVSQVQFIERDKSEKVLIDMGASIHLSGRMHFATCIHSVPPFAFSFPTPTHPFSSCR
ncbi:hypothetical protein O181_003851 [Austropuccinia psidii MF-1]|uniref:CCHC-type domain-containing protein n=1 Tax=Austropuccinia psidii MF-1 TaxID=1389203 RepID=A0A9Q3BFR6_9BASI|nr:hypothetical protein [Austropuccinia psidii MF-1]